MKVKIGYVFRGYSRDEKAREHGQEKGWQTFAEAITVNRQMLFNSHKYFKVNVAILCETPAIANEQC